MVHTQDTMMLDAYRLRMAAGKDVADAFGNTGLFSDVEYKFCSSRHFGSPRHS